MLRSVPSIGTLSSESNGRHFVNVWSRESRTRAYRPRKLLLRLDQYEWQRLKQALGGVDELLKKVESGGAFFKIGD